MTTGSLVRPPLPGRARRQAANPAGGRPLPLERPADRTARGPRQPGRTHAGVCEEVNRPGPRGPAGKPRPVVRPPEALGSENGKEGVA